MNSRGIALLPLLFAMVCPPGPPARAAESESPVEFREVYELVRSNLTGVTESDLRRAAVNGFLRELGPRAFLVENGASAGNAGEGVSRIGRATTYDQFYGYLQIRNVTAGLGAELDEQIKSLATAATLRGLVLDLRFTGGTGFQAVAEVIDRLAPTEQALFTLDGQEVRGGGKPGSLTLPVTLLVNSETEGAAELLAATARQAGAGLILGGTTAGRASGYRDFPLRDGQTLRIASGRIEMAGGGVAGGKGLIPDIPVQVARENERKFVDDPYANTRSRLVSRTGSEPPPEGSPRRINEAELVRMQREGDDSHAGIAASARVEDAKPVLQDPVLARALDLLKGLAVARAQK